MTTLKTAAKETNAHVRLHLNVIIKQINSKFITKKGFAVAFPHIVFGIKEYLFLWSLGGKENLEKTRQGKDENQQASKLDPHMTQGPGIEPRPILVLIGSFYSKEEKHSTDLKLL